MTLDFDTLNINLGLDRVSAVLKELGTPHKKFKSIHVAGTNGKGSVCAMLASILQESGLKVGLFTSPHLFKWNERIRINGEDITDSNVKCQMTNVKLVEEKLGLKLTQFEIITCVAFQYFAEQKVNIAVIEVGMGGRLDATNVITPLVSVITNVELDHTEYLGDTLAKIAEEKAGIIKSGVPVVTAETKPEVLAVIDSAAKKMEAGIEVVMREKKREMRNGLFGSYQRINEAVAVRVSELLAVGRENISAGLSKTVWPARFQIVSQNPFIIIDGAHNPAGAKALIESLQELNLEKPVTFVLGFQGYKNFDSMLQLYSSFSKNIILTRSKHPQSADLSSHPSSLISHYFQDSSQAINLAKRIGDPIVIAGSLFLAAEALEYFQTKT